MKDISQLNSDFTKYTVTTFDMFLDGGADSFMFYVITKPLLEDSGYLTLN